MMTILLTQHTINKLTCKTQGFQKHVSSDNNFRQKSVELGNTEQAEHFHLAWI